MTAPLNHEPDLSLLDNPIWHALSTTHAVFAEGGDLARRYPPAIGPLSGTRDQSPASYRSLAQLLSPGETAALFLEAVPSFAPGWTVVRELPLVQMIWAGSVQSQEEAGIEGLSIANVTEMLALTELTQPGPFGLRTPELGTYLGIRDKGRLAAMAGERLRVPGFTEISAVCTHPEYRGRGYAGSLISTLIRKITGRGEVPFLHAAKENTGAIQVYEKLGFKIRHFRTVVVLRKDG